MLCLPSKLVTGGLRFRYHLGLFRVGGCGNSVETVGPSCLLMLTEYLQPQCLIFSVYMLNTVTETCGCGGFVVAGRNL